LILKALITSTSKDCTVRSNIPEFLFRVIAQPVMVLFDLTGFYIVPMSIHKNACFFNMLGEGWGCSLYKTRGGCPKK
jgi:hypothetical protein